MVVIVRLLQPKDGILSSGGDEYFIVLPQRHGSLGSYEQIASIDSKVRDGM